MYESPDDNSEVGVSPLGLTQSVGRSNTTPKKDKVAEDQGSKGDPTKCPECGARNFDGQNCTRCGLYLGEALE